MKMNEKALRVEGDTNTTPDRERWKQSLGAETLALLAEDERYFLRQSLSTPCLNHLSGCDGVFLTDARGERYFDFHGNSVHQLGYNNRELIERVKTQMDTLAFSPRRYSNDKATECAARLSLLAPGAPRKVLFTPGGASSIGIALKLARVFTGRYKTISLYDAFHGANLDSISVGGEQLFRSGVGPLLPGAIHVPPIDTYRGYMGMNKYPNGLELLLDQLAYVMEQEGDIAALVAEPIRSTSVHVPTPEFWQQVQRICQANDVLLIFDEIPSGIGRTGQLFCTDNFGVDPDIIVLGKGLAGGMVPFSAILAHERLDVAPDKALGHYTFEKNPVASEATLAVLDYIENHSLLEHVTRMSDYMGKRLHAMMERFEVIGDVRGIGLLWGVELVSDRDTKTPAADLALRVFYRALETGLSFKVSSGCVLTLSPPLIISQSELCEALDRLERALEKECAQ